MTSEIPSPPFSALPVRRRETLEIFDTALKLYRRYFWVLMGWSLLVSVTSLTAIFATFLYLFVSPLLYGAVSCCIAAAVRGQNVRFRQCWEFTKPRYGPMLGALFLAWIIFGVVLIAMYFAAALIGVGGVLVLANAPLPVTVVASVVGIVALIVFFSAFGVFIFGWMTMVPIVSCLEDDKRGVPALGRALELLKGHWRRVFGMSLIIGLAMLAVFGIVGGAYVLIEGVASIKEIFGASSDSAIMSLFMTTAVFSTLFLVFWNPAQILIIAVLYLDLRVRREALDLEWTAYATTPPPPPPGPMNLESAYMGGTPLASVPPDLAFSEMQQVATSFAAGGVSEGAVPPPPQPQPSEFSMEGFTPPAETLPSPVETPPDNFAVSPVPPPPVESVSPAELPGGSEISLDKTPASDAPLTGETSGEDEARREV